MSDLQRKISVPALTAVILAAVVLFEAPGSTTSLGDRVLLQWKGGAAKMPSILAQSPTSSGQSGRMRLPLVTDFTSRQVVFPELVLARAADAIGRDPRFVHAMLRRRARRELPDMAQLFARWRNRANNNSEDVERDWSYSLNNGSGGTIAFPAKYVFDVNATPSCTNDFVVTGVNIAGSTTQANLIAFNSLYNTPTGNGLCAGTAPRVLFSYNIGAGVINSYVALSIDGTKVAFNENNGSSSYFHVLRWATGTGNGTTAAAPARPGVGNTAVDVRLPLTGGTSTAPYVDYGSDVAYVTTSDNVVHKFTGVFLGTPAEVTTGGWPVDTNLGGGISTPVFDPVTRRVFFTDSANGGIDYIDDSVVPPVLVTNAFFFAPGLSVAAPVVIDAGNQKVYGFSPNPGATNAVVAQADTSLSAASQVVVAVGRSTSNYAPLMGDFNESYYLGQASSARLYAVGNTSNTNRTPALFAIGFNSSFRMNAAPSNGPLALATTATSGIGSSPITAFYNSTLNRQFLFVGISNRCSAAVTGGCIRSIDVTGNTFPTTGTINNVIFAAAGGTSGITIDNVSGAAGAASVYYTTLNGRTIVKATQAGLQ